MIDKNSIELKPMLKIEEMVPYLKSKNIKFEIISEYNAKKYLREIVKLRNAVAHNSCLLCYLDKKDNKYSPDYKIVNYLNLCGVGKESRDNKLSNSRIKQMTCTLYMFNEIVTSDGIKRNVIEDLNELFYDRIILHKEYYNNNELLKSIYSYFDKIISYYYRVNID